CGPRGADRSCGRKRTSNKRRFRRGSTQRRVRRLSASGPCGKAKIHDGFAVAYRFPSFLEPIAYLNYYLDAPKSLHVSERMALGSRPVFPGWAGMPAETSVTSLAKINVDAVSMEAIFSEHASAKGEDCFWHRGGNSASIDRRPS